MVRANIVTDFFSELSVESVACFTSCPVLSPLAALREDYLGGETLANHKSAEKRARQDDRRYERRISALSEVKTWEKKLRKTIESRDVKAAQDMLKAFMSKVDKAAKRGVFHARTASRKIGRLSARVSSLSSKSLSSK